MEVSPLIRSSHPACPSPDGVYVATLNEDKFQIRRIPSFDLIRTIDLPSSPHKVVSMRWSPITRGLGASNRVLLADEDVVHVWDVQDSEWSATIDDGSAGVGKIANVEFGGDDTEVLVFSNFNAQLTVWSLWTGRSVEIKDPKFAAKGHGRHKNFALLSRPGAHDIVTLHAQRSYDVLRRFAPPTSDAQGLKWSPDGKWLAIWDTASTGYRVFIYTADGNLYRTYTGDYFDDEIQGLGIKAVEWSPTGDFLAVGGYETSITLLSTRTFSPAVHLGHPHTLSPSASSIYIEQATPLAPSGRTYTSPGAPTSPPTATTSSGDKPPMGASLLAFNNTGTLLATRNDAHPTTVWIWDLTNLRSRVVLVQHSVVKKIVWSPFDADLLLIQCIQGQDLIYLWHATANDGGAPRVLEVPSDLRMSAKADARWLRTSGKVVIFYGDMNASAIIWPDGQGLDSPQPAVSDYRAVEGDESIFDIVSEHHVGVQNDNSAQEDITQSDFEILNGSIQDTFDFRRDVSAY